MCCAFGIYTRLIIECPVYLKAQSWVTIVGRPDLSEADVFNPVGATATNVDSLSAVVVGERFFFGERLFSKTLYEIATNMLVGELTFLNTATGLRTVIYAQPGASVYFRADAAQYSVSVKILDIAAAGQPWFRLRKMSRVASVSLYARKAWHVVRHPQIYLPRLRGVVRSLLKKSEIGLTVSSTQESLPVRMTPWACIDGECFSTVVYASVFTDADRKRLRGGLAPWVLFAPETAQGYDGLFERLQAVIQKDGTIGVWALDLDNRTNDGRAFPSLQTAFCPDRLAARPQRDAAYLVSASVLAGLDDNLLDTCVRPEQLILGAARSSPVRHFPLTIGAVLRHEVVDDEAYKAAMRPAGRLPDIPPPAGISIIIPTRDRPDLLEPCLRSLDLIEDIAIEVVVVDNGSSGQGMSDLRGRLADRADIRWLYHDIPFNFSELCNLGAGQATHPMLVFLNDDVEALDGSWLNAMLSYARRSDVGAVGARLLYPDGSLQHAGIATNLVPGPGHPWRGQRLPPHHPVADYPGQVDAVTAACLMIRRDDFQAVGGFDAQNFPITMNDVVLCAHLRAAGLRVIYAPEACLVHKEGQSRPRDDDPEEVARRRGEVATFTSLFPEFSETSCFYPVGLRRDTDQAIPIRNMVF